MSVQELFVDGERLTGGAARERNLSAVLSIANTVRSSYGPNGLDKMIISKIGDVSITNDGATILSSLQSTDSAARILIDLAVQQDEEVGDGTTSVVLLASALIEYGIGLIDEGVHPSIVVSGYKTAFKHSVGFIKSTLTKTLKSVGYSDLLKICESTISSKVIRCSTKLFSSIIVDAVLAIKTIELDKSTTYPIEQVNILKKQGRSMDESIFVSGYAINCVPCSNLMPQRINKARIVCLDMDLQQMKMGLSVKITADTPDDLEEIRNKEVTNSHDKIRRLLKQGANVVFTTKGISDGCSKLLIEAGALGVRRCKRDDLERIALITGTKVYTSFDDITGDEFVPVLGTAESVHVEVLGEEKCMVISTPKGMGASIILRGANEQILDEMERSVHDGLCALKRTLESKSVVTGGGAFEAALGTYIYNFGLSFGTNEQVVIQKFGDALLRIPKTLLVNAALDPNEVYAKLLAEHEACNWDTGLDLEMGAVRNNFKAGVLEPLDTKLKALRAATEAAISILRIDEVIVLAEDEPVKK
ncbi:T-complex protein 1 subunit alpha [Nematocida minor]|uniref:T-complex protein 1 subunit alpha n=1 Tax=Nematocida minor TaxID=1912983 RepID=UPI00221FB026|nr:T-complex protein 1 subunit alpha [Nematocida minor]KAI5192887.1 T-complex protein 1 subunit alpha [Nematocida minor]